MSAKPQALPSDAAVTAVCCCRYCLGSRCLLLIYHRCEVRSLRLGLSIIACDCAPQLRRCPLRLLRRAVCA